MNQKDLAFLNPQVDSKVVEKDGSKEVTLTSDVFARAVYLSVKDSELLHFSDNFFDLHPGEPYTVIVKTDIPAEDLAERLQHTCVNKFLY